MLVVPEAHADNVHPDPGPLPEGRGVEARRKGAAHGLDGREEGARRDELSAPREALAPLSPSGAGEGLAPRRTCAGLGGCRCALVQTAVRPVGHRLVSHHAATARRPARQRVPPSPPPATGGCPVACAARPPGEWRKPGLVSLLKRRHLELLANLSSVLETLDWIEGYVMLQDKER